MQFVQGLTFEVTEGFSIHLFAPHAYKTLADVANITNHPILQAAYFFSDRFQGHAVAPYLSELSLKSSNLYLALQTGDTSIF
jgi:hypothetical protein